MPPIAILDIDGTLVDTNYHHAVAWFRAFARFDLVVPLWEIHRHIGMGGDQLVQALCGAQLEEERGDALREAETEEYGALIGEVRPLEGARQLILDLREAGYRVVLASSAKEQEVEHYLDLLDARDIVDAYTMSDDVEETKPQPDLVHAAIEKVGGDGEAVMIGDSTFDCLAAGAAGVPSVCVLTGGFSPEELREAGATTVYRTVEELRQDVGSLPKAARN